MKDILEYKKKHLISNYMHVLIGEIVAEYFEKLKKYKDEEQTRDDEIPEIIFNFLNNAYFWLQNHIELGKPNNKRKLQAKVVSMKRKEKCEFKKAIKNAKEFTPLIYKLQFFYSLVKKERAQEKYWKFLFTEFKYEDSIGKINKNIDNSYFDENKDIFQKKYYFKANVDLFSLSASYQD